MSPDSQIARVVIVFSAVSGGPKHSVADLVAWVQSKLDGREIDGFNSLRYSDAKIVSAELLAHGE